MTGDDITRLTAGVNATLKGIRTLVYSEREPRDPTMCRFDRSRRLLLGVAGTTPLASLLRPLCALTQATDSDKLRIGVIGSGQHHTLSYMIFAREANRPDPRLAIPIAGDDPEAVQVAAGLVRHAGFEAVVVGKLTEARRFQRGALGYGQPVTAAELRQKLSRSRGDGAR